VCEMTCLRLAQTFSLTFDNFHCFFLILDIKYYTILLPVGTHSVRILVMWVCLSASRLGNKETFTPSRFTQLNCRLNERTTILYHEQASKHTLLSPTSNSNLNSLRHAFVPWDCEVNEPTLSVSLQLSHYNVVKHSP
jgi:hypothetical protein